MARRPPRQFSGALHHVISRGSQRQSIYKDDQDYRRCQGLRGEVVKRYSITLYG